MRKALLGLGLSLLVSACGGRPDYWDAEVELPIENVGLEGSVAVLDPSLDRVLMLTVPADLTLANRPIVVGKNPVNVQASSDRSRLFVLSRGVQPRKNADDELPSLSVIDGGFNPSLLARYSLSDPLQGLALDPEGKWAVVFDAGGVVVNPNELILVRLDDPSATPYSKTIRSFGGRPQRLTFTPELQLPDGPHRLLVVETEQDVTLIDLEDLSRPEVTAILPQTPTGRSGSPAQVDVHDGEPLDPTDARVAIRLKDDSNVMLLELGAPPASEPEKSFKVTVNVADVGGVPSSIAFVQTDGGLRLAALVPSRQNAALVDPATTILESVEFDRPFSRIARITDDVSAASASDVALLWSDHAAGIAFWSLGKTSGTPFRSVDSYDIGLTVSDVLSVPGDQFQHLKLLEGGAQSEFYVLDLDKRQSFPMLTNASGFRLTLSPDGERAWALRPGTKDFAGINFRNLHPTTLSVERNVSAVHEIARADGGRAVLALHGAFGEAGGGLGATVLNALSPDTADTKFYPGLMFGGFQ